MTRVTPFTQSYFAKSQKKTKKFPRKIGLRMSSEILQEYKDVFPKKLPKGLPPKCARDFTITLKEGSTPQKKGVYRMSSEELNELKTQLSYLIDQEFIRPSSRPWWAPVIFVRKMTVHYDCVDYRTLNRLSVKSSYPIPPHWRRHGSVIHRHVFHQDRPKKRLPPDSTRWWFCSVYSIPNTFRHHFKFSRVTVLTNKCSWNGSCHLWMKCSSNT